MHRNTEVVVARRGRTSAGDSSTAGKVDSAAKKS